MLRCAAGAEGAMRTPPPLPGRAATTARPEAAVRGGAASSASAAGATPAPAASSPRRPLPATRRTPRRGSALEGRKAPVGLSRPCLRLGRGGRRAALTLCTGADLGHRFLHRRHRRRAWGGGAAASARAPCTCRTPERAPRRSEARAEGAGPGSRRRLLRLPEAGGSRPGCACRRSRRRSELTAGAPALRARLPSGTYQLRLSPRLSVPRRPAAISRPLWAQACRAAAPNRAPALCAVSVPLLEPAKGFRCASSPPPHPVTGGEWNTPRPAPLPGTRGGRGEPRGRAAGVPLPGSRVPVSGTADLSLGGAGKQWGVGRGEVEC